MMMRDEEETNDDSFDLLMGHSDHVNSLEILPNENLISGSDDKSLKIWNLNKLVCLNTISYGKCISQLVAFKEDTIMVNFDSGKFFIMNLEKAIDSTINSYYHMDSYILVPLSNGKFASQRNKSSKFEIISIKS